MDTTKSFGFNLTYNDGTVDLENFKMDSNFVWLLSSLVWAISWVIYITYYNSRVAGYIITKIVNRLFIKNGCFKVGSFTLNALSGKIMFRNVIYITHDYSMRLQDGYLIFRWWRSYVPKDVSEDLSHSDTRLSVVLNGFELHMYNRSELYAHLEKVFGLESCIVPTSNTSNQEKSNDNLAKDKSNKKQRPEAAMARTWRDLIPVIKMDVSCGRVVFGNRLVPTTLSIAVEESHFVYSTKPAVNTLDRFMHFVKCKGENVRVMLAPSPKYTGMLDDPPRYMGEGFVLMSTNDLELYFYMDEAGIVPETPVLVTLANGDVVESSPPMWGMDIKCGKGTDFSYGPWADRQRENLFKFFYPQDYLPMEVTKQPRPGEKRQMQSFDVRLSLQNESTIDILFSKNKETNAVHINVGAGSYLEITIPWLTHNDGYKTKLNGQFLHLEATTSLQFRDLLSCETLEFSLLCHYPIIWNEQQLWELSLTGCKATVQVIFSHKWFFQDLINDWSSKSRPDILHFVPYTWRVGLTLKHCEILTMINRYNWIDCSSVGQRQVLENSQLALCAHFLHLSFDLPFDEFLPETVPLNFSIQGESIDLSFLVPEFHTSRSVILSLQRNAKLSLSKKSETIPKWRNICQPGGGWIDMWWVPIGAINISYVYHPCPPLGPQPQADISTPVKEELLLSPIRFPHSRKVHRPSHDGKSKFDPNTLKADKVTVELEIGPSVLLLYGTVLANLLNFKENIFGEDQMFVDMQCSNNAGDIAPDNAAVDEEGASLPPEMRDNFDHRNYRPLEVDVSIIMHDIQAHLLKNCTENDPPCPVILIERFGFEMKKRYDQTELQLLVSPSILAVSDNTNRASKDRHLNHGRLTLSALQVRGHAMFSDVDRSLDQDTLEYAWLLEVQLGKLSGKISLPQLHTLYVSLETLFLLMSDAENDLESPKTVRKTIKAQKAPKTLSAAQYFSQNVQQTIQQFLQNKNAPSTLATAKSQQESQPAPERPRSVRKSDAEKKPVYDEHNLKYRFCRVAVDAVDLWLVESGTALQFWMSPLRLATCNLHGKQVGSGLSCVIYGLSMRQIVWQPHKYNHNKVASDAADLWLEVGSANFGTIVVESAMSCDDAKEKDLYDTQQKFLRTHDEKNNKLWFLWCPNSKCGCVAGCQFFGANKNGERFFKPSRKDFEDGTNIAAFRVNEPGDYPGFGQSILHEGLLIFRTPPYIINEISLQDSTGRLDEPKNTTFASPLSLNERKVGRRFSSTSIKSKDVPYARLVSGTQKLDSDSKLNTEKSRAALNVPDSEKPLPKNSVSDSKLAVDYFNAKKAESVGPCGDSLEHQVQRTVSISSENHSEAFFSADEDLINSRSSSLRNSVAGANLSRQCSGESPKTVPVSHKKFSSEMNIVTRAGRVVDGAVDEKSCLLTHRSDHEIHTPEHRISSTLEGLVTPQRVSKPAKTEDDSSSDTYSNTSYASAVGSQEDFTLIDLHMQVNRQIIESPMLMSSYVGHLSQLKCSNWNLPEAEAVSVPLYRKNKHGTLVYTGGRFVPDVETLAEGVTSLKMVARSDVEDGNCAKTPTFPLHCGWAQNDEPDTELLQEEELLSKQGDAGSRTSLIIKLWGDVDVSISPLLLETLQRFVDALTPVVATAHPSTVINHLHLLCINQVERANVLKKRLPPQPESEQPSASCDVYEETIKTQLQASVSLPKINITLLQVSVVEEIISISALDNIRDLTCVSLFSVCFDDVTVKLHFDEHKREVLQTFNRPAVVQMGSKKGFTKAKAFLLGQHSNTIADTIRGEPVSIESCDLCKEQVVISLNIGKIHSQLRRLKNESSILDDAVITAIPAYYSKVLFTCVKPKPIFRGTDYYMQPQPQTAQTPLLNDEEKLGFIMFECGVDGVSLKLVNKSQQDRDNSFNEEKEKTPETPKSTKGEAAQSAEQPTPKCNDGGNVSSCVIELKSVWFNFAAPPRAPITRKLDYTRLDWNLLSTASPAINAWMNPSNRFAIRVVHMLRSSCRRSTAIVACLMAEALEVQALHMLSKSRYGILTRMSKTLQEDPSCQLCTILQKYVLQTDAIFVENNLRENELPQLSILRQGVIVLSRQWKNILYTPLLLEPDNKFKAKPLNVTIAVPEIDEELCLTDGEASGNEDPDVTDEHAMLLHSGIILKPNMQKHLDAANLKGSDCEVSSPQVAVVSAGVETVLTSPSPTVSQRRNRSKQLQVMGMPSSSRASIVFPLLAGNPFFQRKQNEDIGYGMLREDKTGAMVQHLGSDPSLGTHSSPDLPSSPLHRAANKTHSNEDLYSWMAKQDKQENVGLPLRGLLQSKIDTLQTESSGEVQLDSSCVALYPMQDSLRLLDAHFIFQPLLTSLGVMSRQLVTTVTGASAGGNVTSLDALGSNLSLMGNMDSMRVDIVVSEHGKVDRKKSKGKSKHSRPTIEINKEESPAFMCEKISVEIQVDRKADMTVNDMIRAKNVLYISRGQLKKHTSTKLHFNVGVRFISQRVNMPLLRLLHQITNMYQNVKETQNELREQRPIDVRRSKTSTSDHVDIKHQSSSASDMQETLVADARPAVLRTPEQPQKKAAVSPSASIKSRPQSFAQKWRSSTSGKQGKGGYTNLNEGAGTPACTSSPSGSAAERISHVSSDKSGAGGKCWKTIYHLLDLYAAMPDTKTITHRFSMGAVADGDANKRFPERGTNPVTCSLKEGDRTKLEVFGLANIHKTKLLATLSGLKLDAEITGVHTSLSCQNKSKPICLEVSLMGQVGRTNIKLLEGVAPNQLQTVVKATIGKSQALYSMKNRKNKDQNSALFTVGAVVIEIPQHPVALHGMVTRSSKQLSSTLQELRVTRTSSRLSRGVQADEDLGHASPNYSHNFARAPPKRPHAGGGALVQPLVVQFSVMLQSLSVTAALLPSLQAQYKMDQVKGMGTTGDKAKFNIDLPQHSLSFSTKLPSNQVTDLNLPPEACIALPAVHVTAEYVAEGAPGPLGSLDGSAKPAEGVVFRQGGYFRAQAEIGVFEHSLTTDLLNHLVFVQNIFMREVNEVIQKVYGGERPVPIWLEDSDESASFNSLLFTLVIRIQRIQLTATTAGSSAVRLETGAVTLELSNRVQNVSGARQARLFGKAQVDINLSLGQLLRNALFEEAETEFQQFAFFNTRVGFRNAFQEEIARGDDKEVVLITLKRPLIYVQPIAVDKAILVWLNYKNAYDYWNDKRAGLNKEKLQLGQITSQLSAQHLGTLFLQLTVEDMGICLPLNALPQHAAWMQRNVYEEGRGAVVVTLESTSISACSSGSLVSKGKFSNLCLRFAEDFEASLDDWKPDMNDTSIMNLCVVSEGTYEVCSRTVTEKLSNENAKWFLNVQWQMEGVDIHLDTNVGKQLSSLGYTLTSLTGAEESPFQFDYDSDENEPLDGMRASQESILPPFIFNPSLDNKQRSKLIEKEMNEQAKIINDLRSLGASHGTIEIELRRLHELEALVYKDFRRDMMQKLRRQSVRASSITKGKLGIGNTANTYRSKSFVTPSPMLEHRNIEIDSPEEGHGGSPSSYESSPRSGPSRSSSLRHHGAKVTFDVQNMCRQSSLPAASSESSLPDTWAADHHLLVDGERVELRTKLPPSYESEERSDDASPSLLTSDASFAIPPQQLPHKSPEPNIDLELDVKVFINSGKCVLHTKDLAKEEEIKISRMRKDRSCSAGLLEFPAAPAGSPDASRRNKDKLPTTTSSARLRNTPHNSLVDLTIFHIPGMDVKLHYISKVLTQEPAPAPKSSPETVHHDEDLFPFPISKSTSSEDDLAFTRRVDKTDLKPSSSAHGISAPFSTHRASGTFKKPTTVKKASLFAWMTLQSVPEETIISPHILEFLEQTLEPIPSKGSVSTASDLPAEAGVSTSAVSYGNYVYAASFPVDVIVYFHMQPSTFRFSCLPVSRVECMLQLPSLDIVFSSKRAEDELFLHSEFGEDNSASSPSATAVGGLSVTGCLADFSVYIFHPYGGGKKSTLKEPQWSPLSDSERKDSLSINVEFVKFHLSRSRMLNIQSQHDNKSHQDQSRAVIRFSTITDIGSASFKYDMRRLTEILAFPKAWYRRSIVRRLFLGDLSISAVCNDEEECATGAAFDGSHRHKHDKSPSTGHKTAKPFEQTKLKDIGKSLSVDETREATCDHVTTSWETLVLFAVNFKKLNVHMNMGNVMGNVTWLTKDFRSEGRLSIGSTGHKNLYIALGLGGSSLDAKGGIVGGNIEIANVDTFVHIHEEPNIEPDHMVGLRLYAVELRLDYMATSVLMCRISDLNVNLRDEWHLNKMANNSSYFNPTRRPASIFIHGDLGWDQMQIMISKSTTADLLKMFNKLEEFFSQQFNSSKRAFSGFSSQQSKQKIKESGSIGNATTASPSSSNDAKHHRHWQKVLDRVAGLQLTTMHSSLPLCGTVLGGTMELHGNNISLACFHGINFKSKSWALFSLKEPCITFNTEAQEIPSPSTGGNSPTYKAPAYDVHVVQTLTCSLGLSTYKTHHSMATVCKVSRTVIFPPQFKTLQEWFHYAFSSNQIDEVDRFPTLERDKPDPNNSMERAGRGSVSKTTSDPSHSREVIFALPSLQLHLKTEHLQSNQMPKVDGAEEKPTVECSFITEFEDHIFVTVDAEAFFFLHDLITSYVKEKERVLGRMDTRSSGVAWTPSTPSPSSGGQLQTAKMSLDDLFTRDWRNYNCKTWHLEPTVRLMSVAGKYIEPYGIDYILQKLGFSHARTTIPKWMQRGFMDPLDAILAVLSYKMVQVIGDNKKEESHKNPVEQAKK